MLQARKINSLAVPTAKTADISWKAGFGMRFRLKAEISMAAPAPKPSGRYIQLWAKTMIGGLAYVEPGATLRITGRGFDSNAAATTVDSGCIRSESD